MKIFIVSHVNNKMLLELFVSLHIFEVLLVIKVHFVFVINPTPNLEMLGLLQVRPHGIMLSISFLDLAPNATNSIGFFKGNIWNALRQQRCVCEVMVQFNLCMEPCWDTQHVHTGASNQTPNGRNCL
ncbi:unnamed protein product [Fraxinus pennsylvanica]|uniref:Uncharacterized protein n=1 Tax=Fraxinus pennsylvanica TaxID=56036 RepID=A0AAD1ZKA4_9LAMI|nr:unnamed protein product [Fraxinus pennsylvanica]